jgi:hypothetical protein
MFSFWFRHKISDEEVNKLIPLYEGDRGLEDLCGNHAELRVWIPEPLKIALTEVAERQGTTMSVYLREFFVIYLYGIHELLCMRDNKTGIFHSPPQPQSQPARSSPLFSRAKMVNYIPGLGKNIVPFKLYMHSKIKSDLATLAIKADMPLSQFVREILVSHFLGHTVWPQRNLLWTREQQDIADSWTESRIQEASLVDPTADEEDAREGKIEFVWC